MAEDNRNIISAQPGDLASGAEELSDSEYGSRPYAWYVVFVLLLIYVLAYVDRQVLALLVEPIKRDLDISDTEMSLLLGFAFAFFYTLVGLPMGRLADRSNRRNIIIAGVTIWSVATALCGLARNYTQLFLSRMGIGLGEACLNPAVVPLLSDYFPKRRLGRAIGVYMLGISIGGGLANIVGGNFLDELSTEALRNLPLIGAIRPWQAVLLILGLTGIVVVPLLLTIREPSRKGRIERDALGAVVSLPLSVIFSHLKSFRWAYVALFAPLVASATMSFGIGYWIPAFFQRSFGISTVEAGEYLVAFGLVSMVVGAISVVAGGFLVDYLATRYRDGHLRALGIGLALITPGFGLFALMPSPTLAIVALLPALVGNGILQASGVTALMGVVPTQMKSQIAALNFFIINLIGAALGPTIIALITDGIFGNEESLRYSIAIVAFFIGSLGLALLFNGRSPYRQLQELD